MILFDNPLRDRMIAALPRSRHVEAAKKMLDSQHAANKHKEYKAKAVMSGAKTLERMNASYKK